MKIINPGLLTTIQDTGREGYRSIGVMKSGAMDLFAHRIANLLVGNDEEAACIEFTGSNYQLKFDEDAIIAITGAGSKIFLNDQPVSGWRTIFISAEAKLSAKPAAGMRTYLAIGGGWKIERILNSFSTHLTAGFGGFEGRSLKKNDELGVAKNFSVLNKKIYGSLQSRQLFKVAEWSLSPFDFPSYSAHPTIRVIEGNEFSWMKKESAALFFSESFEISAAANRMGYRLKGQKLMPEERKELISTALAPGTIQLTPDGSLLLLMADAQTTGGYPRIAQVAAVDIPLVAQLKPGDKMNFTEISFEEAEQLFLQQEQKIQYIRESIALHFA